MTNTCKWCIHRIQVGCSPKESNYRWCLITLLCACARAGLSNRSSGSCQYMSKNDKTASNTLNTYLYCCKCLPRTVNQILHLPSSLRSKNSLHGLRWGGFWIATPLPATQTLPRHGITCTSYSTPHRAAPRMCKGGVEMRTWKPSLKVRENLQFQEEK